MTFFFQFLDVLLTTILLFDILGLAYQIRKEGKCDSKQYVRVCLTWILFLTLCSLLSCEKKGFFGMILRLLIFCVKACIALPILGGTLKVYKFLVEDGNAELYYKKISDLIKSTICKGTECASSNFSSQSSRLRNNIEGPSTPQ